MPSIPSVSAGLIRSGCHPHTAECWPTWFSECVWTVDLRLRYNRRLGVALSTTVPIGAWARPADSDRSKRESLFICEHPHLAMCEAQAAGQEEKVPHAKVKKSTFFYESLSQSSAGVQFYCQESRLYICEILKPYGIWNIYILMSMMPLLINLCWELGLDFHFNKS